MVAATGVVAGGSAASSAAAVAGGDETAIDAAAWKWRSTAAGVLPDQDDVALLGNAAESGGLISRPAFSLRFAPSLSLYFVRVEKNPRAPKSH